MFEQSNREFDQSLFQPDQAPALTAIIIEAAQSLEQSREIVSRYENFDAEAQRAGITEEFEDNESYRGLVELFDGDDTVVNELVASVTGIGAPEVKDAEYERACRARDEAAATLIDHACGYQAHMKQNLVEQVGETEEEAIEQAWKATWKKLHAMLYTAEGTLLAEVAGFVDELIKTKYGKDYMAMERDRGPVVREDVCARTFYEIMEDHLHRAIIGANRDEWTGYK
ncbi:MAG TPA: hypothetical protein VK712_01660 [Verrucomicrobiae bacterium]|jgi:hypothetical protein|nr:hypothetical protein [Verrucomicrobiae bacterium]